MPYIEGFVVAVPTANKEAYRAHAAEAAPIFKDFGATRMVEAWADDVPDGTVTDFRKAVQAKEDESVVFSWFEYPSKEVRDAANQRMMTDPRMEAMAAAMPFDGKRMIMGGFQSFIDAGGESAGTYVDGFVLPLGNEEGYRALAAKAEPIFREYGALRVVEAIGDDVPHGEVTDFYRAVKAQDNEGLVFSWIEWPSKAARDAGWGKMMEDERMKPDGDMPFDGKRMFWGGFLPIVDA